MKYAENAHPARALYRFWLNVLENTNDPTHIQPSWRTAFGTPRWGLSVQGETSKGPIIGYGWLDQSSYSYFDLAPDGRFRLWGMWGYERRVKVAKQTFLGFGHTAGLYQWYVDLDPSKPQYGRSLTDPDDRRRYYHEDLIGCRGRRYNRGERHIWMSLEQRDDGWGIVPAVNQADGLGSPATRPGPAHVIRASRWRRYEALVDKRYDRVERRRQIRQGIIPAPQEVSARTVTVRDGNTTLTEDEAVLQLVALLEVTSPAKSTPLRPKEAHHGNNLAP